MGALLEAEGTLFATLPGVPPEMKRMFEETLEPLIRARSEGAIVSRTLWFAGIGESALAEKVQDFLDADDPTVAPLAGQGKVRLRITTRAATAGGGRGQDRAGGARRSSPAWTSTFSARTRRRSRAPSGAC